MTKLTKKIALVAAISAIEANENKEWRIAGTEDAFSKTEIVAKLWDMVKQLDAKATSPKKPTKTQQENEDTKARILEVLGTVGRPVTITELMAADSLFATMANQKLTALVRQLVKDGAVERSEDKRKAFFSLAK